MAKGKKSTRIKVPDELVKNMAMYFTLTDTGLTSQAGFWQRNGNSLFCAYLNTSGEYEQELGVGLKDELADWVKIIKKEGLPQDMVNRYNNAMQTIKP